MRAGCRDLRKPAALELERAGATLVLADVTAGAAQIEAAIGDAAAVVCCTGFTPSFNLLVDNPRRVDGEGTRALIDAATRKGVKRFILITSLLTNAAAVGQAENPNYKCALRRRARLESLRSYGALLDHRRCI